MRVAVVHTAGAPCECAECLAVGLAEAGHEPVLFDSASVALEAGRIAAFDLVVDHTDTYLGRGLLRPFVRWLLEEAGACVVGADARACLLADDKARAKACLAAAGVPTVPGFVATAVEPPWPPGLDGPLVLKPAFEHMSRGLAVVADRREAEARLAALLGRHGQPVLVERYVAGRELAVSLLEGDAGLEVLPVLEWRLPPGGRPVLDEASKLEDRTLARDDAAPAGLPPAAAAALEGFARAGFRALGLRDYARFDVRLAVDGTPFFLEANTTPSLEFPEALALSARWAGLSYKALAGRLAAAGARRRPGPGARLGAVR